jgi:hypothetical protein
VVEVKNMTSVLVDLGLVPPARLGPFVEMGRQQLGMSREEFSQATAGRLTVQDITLLERGRLVCRDTQLAAIQDALGVQFARTVPTRTRLIIDPTQGRLVIGGNVAEVLPDVSDEELLLRYLALVYLCRRARPGTYVVPRADDVETLSEVMDTTTARVRQRLARMPHEHRDVLRLAVRRATGGRLLPGLGLFVGVHQRGALVMIDSESNTGDTQIGSPQPNPVDGDRAVAAVVPIGPARERRNQQMSEEILTP